MPDFRITSRNNLDDANPTVTVLHYSSLSEVLDFLAEHNRRDAANYSRMLINNPSSKTMRTRWFHAMVCPDFTATEIVNLNKEAK